MRWWKKIYLWLRIFYWKFFHMNLEKLDGTFIKIRLEDISSVELGFLNGEPVIILTIGNSPTPIYLKYAEPNLSLLNGLFVNYFSKKNKIESKDSTFKNNGNN